MRIAGLLRRFQAAQSGNIALMLGISAPALMLVVGAATSTYLEANAKNQLQQAIDTSVLAGASLPGGASNAERIATAQKYFDQNILQLTGDREDPDAIIRVSGTPQFRMQSIHLVGTVSADIYNPFGKFFGNDWNAVSGKAAAKKRLSDPVCVLGLNPRLDATIDFNGHAQLDATNCAIQANSESGEGIKQVGQPLAKATMIGVTGGASGDGYSIPPVEGASPVPDPYADIPFPAADACDPSDKGLKIQQQTVTIPPGTHCGGISVMADSNVTFAPGIHVFVGGPLDVRSGGFVDGEEVLFAFGGDASTLYMGGSAEMKVTSPMAGVYANMQFMSDRDNIGGNAWGVNLVGNVKLEFDGSMYFPGQDIWLGGGSVLNAVSPSYAIVGDKIWIQDQSVVTVTQENRRGVEGFAAASGFGYGAVLVD